MESVGDVLKRQPSRFQYQDLVQKIMKDLMLRPLSSKNPSAQRN